MQTVNVSLINTHTILYKKEQFICFFIETLFFIGCMLPAFSKCWDEYIIPKWYAAISIVLITMSLSLLYPSKYKAIYAQWKSVLPYSAGFGILFLTCIVIHDIYALPILLFEYGVDGPYSNPSCLAVTICLLYPLTLRFGKDKPILQKEKLLFLRIWNISYSLISICLLFCTHSRIGIIVFVSFMAVLLYRFILNKTVLSMTIVILLLIIFAICCSTLYKSNSTNGRSFILMRTAELISKRPLLGYGFSSFEKTYMEYQGEYFKRHPESKYAKLADNIKHPLNEFAKLWLENGIVAPIILLILIIIPLLAFRNNLIITMIETCLLLFCLFSYPLTLPLPTILLFIFPTTLFLSSFKSEKIIKTIIMTFLTTTFVWYLGAFYIDNLLSSAAFYSLHRKHNRALLKYSKLYSILNYPSFKLLYLTRYKVFMYNYTRELFTTSNFTEALQMTTKTERYIKNYDTQLLKADIYYNMNEYDRSIKSYKTAYNMCPVKFGPLEGLLNCYGKQKNYILEKQLAKMILTKNIKVNSEDINKIRNKAFLILHKLQMSQEVSDPLKNDNN